MPERPAGPSLNGVLSAAEVRRTAACGLSRTAFVQRTARGEIASVSSNGDTGLACPCAACLWPSAYGERLGERDYVKDASIDYS